MNHGISLVPNKIAAVAERAPKIRLAQAELFEKWQNGAVAAGWRMEEVEKKLGATFAPDSKNDLTGAIPQNGAVVARLKQDIATAVASPFDELCHYSISFDDRSREVARKMDMRKNLTLVHPHRHAEGGLRQSHEKGGEQKLSTQPSGAGLLAKLSELADRLLPHRKELASDHDNPEKRKEKDKTLHP